LQLEGVRGLAAMIVVAWHFIWAFAPRQLGSVAGLAGSGLIGNPLLAVIDGPAAVAVFFVLSGFVLPLGFLRSGQPRVVLHAAAKRWLRLAGLSVLAVLLAWLLFHLGLFRYREAARLTQSDWLRSYGGGDPHGTLNPSLLGSVREGLVSAFVRNSDPYFPVLWTMRHELFGSFVSLGSALAISRTRLPVGCGILLLVAIVVPLFDPWLIPFVAGTALAFVALRRRVRLPGVLAMACIAAGVFLFGYLQPRGAYAALAVVQDSAGYRYDRILTHTLGGVLILLGLIGNDSIGRLLSVRPLLELGRLSFPIYLFHFPLLCSLACCLFLAVQPALPYGFALAVVAAVYLPVVLAVGWLFARVDEAWGRWVNRSTDRLLSWGTDRAVSRAT
jgi:peptidoglycan/LPS O-acetylase OafA/YrhL